ncbi:MAG: AAA family ATPase [archaeon]
MKQNLFFGSKKLNELFKDERFLYNEYIPERLPHREKEINSLVFALNPLAKGRKAINTVLLGKTGTGKTVTTKYVLKELEEFTDRAKSHYINCFEFNSRAAILAEVTNFLGFPVPRRGLAVDEVYSKLLSALKRIDFTPIIVLDEIDQLMHGNESKILYDLLRVIEFEKKFIAIILISNNFEFTAGLDARVKSSLAEQTITFESYSPIQLKDILNERIQQSFLPGKVEKEAVNVAAAHAARLGGDARIAIECLLKGGRIAEKGNAAKLQVTHLKEAFELVDRTPFHKATPFLKGPEKELLKVLVKNTPINSGNFFAQYKKTSSKPLSLRQFRNIINELEKKKLIEVKPVEKGLRGKSRMISLKAEKELLEKELNLI